MNGKDIAQMTMANALYELATTLSLEDALARMAQLIGEAGISQKPIDISLAPRNGERLLLFPSVHVHDSCSIGYWNDDFGWMVGGSPAGIAITHWLPMPDGKASGQASMNAAVSVVADYLPPFLRGDGNLQGEARDPNLPMTEERKMWLIVRKDINMLPEKAMAQAGHGFLTSWLRALITVPDAAIAYLDQAQPKITVGVDNEEQLIKAHEACKGAGLPSVLVRDAGRTFFPEPTNTVVCVGPCFQKQLPPAVKRLRLLKTEPVKGE